MWSEKHSPRGLSRSVERTVEMSGLLEFTVLVRLGGFLALTGLLVAPVASFHAAPVSSVVVASAAIVAQVAPQGDPASITETQLAAFSPAGARFYISHGLDTLLGHLREVLQIPPNAKLMRRPDRVVVYGWSSLS